MSEQRLATDILIRPSEERDDVAFARLFSLLTSAPYDVQALRDRRKRYGERRSTSLVAELDGEVRGIAELMDSGAVGNAFCRIVVQPEFRRKGIGSKLAETLSGNPLFSAKKVFTQIRDDEPESLSFTESLGFRRKAHVFESYIDPSKFEFQKFARFAEQIKSSGLRITTLAELGVREETLYNVWELENITDLEIPGLDPDQLPSWEDAKRAFYTAPWFKPEGEFLALDGGRFVGASAVAELAPGIWNVLHTCTLRDYRGRGIATGLKALATQFAKEQGSTLLKTNNHSENEPMLSINRRFGFEPLPGWFELTKESQIQ